MSIKGKILSQSTPRLWVGGIRDSITRTQSYYALINMPLLLITVYTLRQPQILRIFPWLSLEVFLGIVICALMCVAILDYKYIKPSLIAFQQSEAWKHRSLARQQFQKNQERIEKIETSLADVKEAMVEIKTAMQDINITLVSVKEKVKHTNHDGELEDDCKLSATT